MQNITYEQNQTQSNDTLDNMKKNTFDLKCMIDFEADLMELWYQLNYSLNGT